MEGLKNLLNKISATLKKLPRKQVALVTMCTMLSITVILAVVVAVKVAPVAALLFQMPDGPDPQETTESTGGQNETEPSGTQSPLATDPAHVHAFDIFIKTVQPTCTESGYSLYLCICGERDEKDIVKATGHSFGAGKLVSATCEDQGYTEYVCSVCKHVEQKNKTPSLGGHIYRLSESFEPACGVDGKDVYICETCQNIKEEITAPAFEHVYELKEEKEPTCSEKGYKRYVCTNEGCEDFYDDVIEATGHVFAPWETVTSPSAGNPGKEARQCAICQEKETRTCELVVLNSASDESGGSKHYTVEVGARDTQNQDVTVYTYEIFDKSGITFNFSYDQKDGLVIRFMDGSDRIIAAKPGNATINIDQNGNKA